MDVNQDLAQTKHIEKKQRVGEQKFDSVSSYLKSKNALLVFLGLISLTVGLIFFLKGFFLTFPPTSNVVEQRIFDPNLPSKGFSEVTVPLSSNIDLLITDQSNDFIKTDQSKFLLARNSRGSYIYQINGDEIKTYFSTPKNLKDVLIYKSSSIVYTIQENLHDEVWIRDESGSSFLMYKSEIGEKVQSIYFDTNTFVLYALVQFASESAKIISIELSREIQILNVSGNISPNLRFIMKQDSSIYLSDSKVCFEFSLVTRQYQQTSCEGKIFSNFPIFRFRPEFSLFFSSSLNSTIDQYNYNISEYVRIFNGSGGEIIFPHDISNNKILISRIGLTPVSAANFYQANFGSLSFFEIQTKTFIDIYDKLPSNSNWNNFKFFVSKEKIYAIDYGSSPIIIYLYEPNNIPVSIPLSFSTDGSESFKYDENKWTIIEFANQPFGDVKLIHHFPYFLNHQHFSLGF